MPSRIRRSSSSEKPPISRSICPATRACYLRRRSPSHLALLLPSRCVCSVRGAAGSIGRGRCLGSAAPDNAAATGQPAHTAGRRAAGKDAAPQRLQVLRAGMDTAVGEEINAGSARAPHLRDLLRDVMGGEVPGSNARVDLPTARRRHGPPRLLQNALGALPVGHQGYRVQIAGLKPPSPVLTAIDKGVVGIGEDSGGYLHPGLVGFDGGGDARYQLRDLSAPPVGPGLPERMDIGQAVFSKALVQTRDFLGRELRSHEMAEAGQRGGAEVVGDAGIAAVVEMDAIYIVTAGDVGEDLEQMLLDGGVARLKENPLAVIVWNGRAVPVTVAG